MATEKVAVKKDESSVTLIPSADSQKDLLAFCQKVLIEHKKFSSYHDKMEVIDVAYARYQVNKLVDGVVQGQGVDAATTPVGIMNLPSTTPPVVVSQVDSVVAYLADVFLSGTPMFPVVSNPLNKKEAENLEVLIDDHAILGGYARQFLLFFKDGVKYNFSALEADWESIDQYSITDEVLQPGKTGMSKVTQKYTKVRRLDPYNVVWDHTVNPGDVSAEGDYAGYLQVKTRTKLKTILNRLGNDKLGFNTKEALASGYMQAVSGYDSYRKPPQVSDYIQSRIPQDGMDWVGYITGKSQTDLSTNRQKNNYEQFILYARIIPSDFGLVVPSPNTPQVWKLRVINNSVLVEAHRIISAYDYLPILFGQPLEDGLGFQTQSMAEAAIPFQTAAATMMNIRFNSARRAVSDRALYDSSAISHADINAPIPAAKIPVNMNSLDGKTLADAYYQIPFDASGTENALQDGIAIANFSKDLAGLNNPRRGQFQKGNKSVSEFETTMAGGDAILRMPALMLEHQVFIPFKAILKLNIFQYGIDVKIISQKTGQLHEIDINKLRQQVLSFRIADGYTPKSKLASTDAINGLIQAISTSQILQVAYGAMLPNMIAHLAQLQGIYGLDQYTPIAQPATTAPNPTAPSLPAAGSTEANTAEIPA